MVILHVNLEMPGKVIDTLTQQRDLHFRRARIGLMNPELLYHCLPVRFTNSHVNLRSFSLFLSFVAQFSTIPLLPCKGASNEPGSVLDSQRTIWLSNSE